MSNVAVQKVDDQARKTLPVFAEITKRFQDVRRRAFELFERRGCELGHAVEDWAQGGARGIRLASRGNGRAGQRVRTPDDTAGL